ncbi:MAG: (4Fe-4S)-binding protein [Acidiphilium sp.]|nr:(4Fe-4S)-binding protein [Acidiphilium sp.]MDD4936644.1 (4Fe-4S)-binding protein [Acidiphilium sp.]
MKVLWDESICTHSGHCVRTLPKVFRVEAGKFVIDPAAAPDEGVLRETVAKCPSGALTIEDSGTV